MLKGDRDDQVKEVNKFRSKTDELRTSLTRLQEVNNELNLKLEAEKNYLSTQPAQYPTSI